MFIGVLNSSDYQSFILFNKEIIHKYYGFHQTLGHFRQQKVAVCGKVLS